MVKRTKQKTKKVKIVKKVSKAKIKAKKAEKKSVKKIKKVVAKAVKSKKKILPKKIKVLKVAKKVAVKSKPTVSSTGAEKPLSKKLSAEKKIQELEAKSDLIIEKGKKRGFITYDEIIKIFPDIENNIIFLDELYEKLSVAGVDVLEGGNLLDVEGDTDKLALKYSKDAQTYDSIQMYLKEIGLKRRISLIVLKRVTWKLRTYLLVRIFVLWYLSLRNMLAVVPTLLF